MKIKANRLETFEQCNSEFGLNSGKYGNSVTIESHAVALVINHNFLYAEVETLFVVIF